MHLNDTYPSSTPQEPSKNPVFDDFDIVDNGNGFVIANIMNIPDYGAGSLLFVESHCEEGKLKGELKDTFRDYGLKSPSSVKVVKQNINGSDFFKAGDIVITEKGRHCVSRLRLDNEWCQWLTRDERRSRG